MIYRYYTLNKILYFDTYPINRRFTYFYVGIFNVKRFLLTLIAGMKAPIHNLILLIRNYVIAARCPYLDINSGFLFRLRTVMLN